MFQGILGKIRNTGVLSGIIDKSISKVLAVRPQGGPQEKTWRIEVSFFHPEEGAARSFEVCLPRKVFKYEEKKLRATIYCASLPTPSYGVVSLVLSRDPGAPRSDPLRGAGWFCRFSDGSECSADVKIRI